jgi:hypothetical protein
MQRRFEEAEQALKRALEIDPEYKFAERNLGVLDQARKSGQLPLYGGVRSPFEGHQVRVSVIPRPEEMDE